MVFGDKFSSECGYCEDRRQGGREGLAGDIPQTKVAASCLKLTVNSDTPRLVLFACSCLKAVSFRNDKFLGAKWDFRCLSSPPAVYVFDDGTFEDPLLPLLHMVVSGKDRRPNR